MVGLQTPLGFTLLPGSFTDDGNVEHVPATATPPPCYLLLKQNTVASFGVGLPVVCDLPVAEPDPQDVNEIENKGAWVS